MNRQNKITKQRSVKDYVLIGVLSTIVLYLLFFFIKSTIYTIPDQSRGVMFKTYDGGLKMDKVYEPGLYFIAPYNHLITYDISTQQDKITVTTFSMDEALISVEVRYSFNPVADKIGHLHNEIGPSYDVRIKPEIKYATREVIKQYSRYDLDDSKKESIKDEILAISQRIMKTKYIELNKLELISISPIE